MGIHKYIGTVEVQMDVKLSIFEFKDNYWLKD